MNFIERIKNYPTHMDYEGQKLAEKLFHIIIIAFGAFGFFWGYWTQKFSDTVLFLFVGFCVSCLVVLPPWPCFRRSPLDWQKPRPQKNDKKDEKPSKKKQKAN